MATFDQVYDSICDAIQKQIDIIDNLDIKLTDEQLQDIIRRIGLLNNALEEYVKRFKR